MLIARNVAVSIQVIVCYHFAFNIFEASNLISTEINFLQVLEEHQLIVGVVVVVDPGNIRIK